MSSKQYLMCFCVYAPCSWQFPQLRLGNKRELELEDIYRVLPEDGAVRLKERLELNWNREKMEAKYDGTRKPSLLKAIVQTFGLPFALATLSLVIQQSILQLVMKSTSFTFLFQ